MLISAVFLDRDGTINIDRGYVFGTDDWTFSPNAITSIKRLKQNSLRVVVVSNQSGVGHGLFTSDDVKKLHTFVQNELSEFGTKIDAFAYCPHTPNDNCGCRKPKTGLARQIEEKLGDEINYASSWTIGDKVTDVQFGDALGTKTALIRSRYWSEDSLEVTPNIIADSLHDVVNQIVSAQKQD